MAIRFACPYCGQSLEVAIALSGKTTTCVGCGQLLAVPAMGILVSSSPRGEGMGPSAQTASARGLSPWWIGGTALGVGALLVVVVTALSWHVLFPKTRSEAREARAKDLAIRAELPTSRNTLPSPAAEPEQSPSRSEITPSRPPDRQLPPRETESTRTPPPSTEPMPNVMKPLVLVWRLKEGDTFYQELTVSQKSNLRVQGLPASSQLQYRVVSRFTVQQVGQDGSLGVEQKIEQAKLLQADALTQSVLGNAVSQLPGTKFHIRLNRNMEVTDFRGEGGQPMIGGLQFPFGQGMQMTSLLDRDGWKEMAQATFFNRDQPLTPNARWSKPMTHQWGPLGTWAGQIHYAYAGRQGTSHKIAYAMQLAHQAPTGGTPLMGLAINGATFQAQEAGGTLFFDATRGRVLAAEERFRVRGVLNLQLLGQNTPLEIDEEQNFQIRILDSVEP
jgi:hypothetical protein